MSSFDISYQAAVHTLEIAVLTLTGFNTFAAALVFVFVLFDNHHYGKSWLRISTERRTPLFGSIAIVISQVVFLAREVMEMGSVVLSTSDQNTIPGCPAALGQLSWWGIWFPLIAIGLRVCLMAGAILLKARSPFLSGLISSTIHSQTSARVSIFLL